MLQVKWWWAKLHLRRPVLFSFHVVFLDHQLVRMVCRCTVWAFFFCFFFFLCVLSRNINKSARDGVGSQLSSSTLHCQCARTRKLGRQWKYKVDTGLRKWSISPLIHSSCLHLSLRSHLQLHLSSANEDWHMVMILVIITPLLSLSPLRCPLQTWLCCFFFYIYLLLSHNDSKTTMSLTLSRKLVSGSSRI